MIQLYAEIGGRAGRAIWSAGAKQGIDWATRKSASWSVFEDAVGFERA
jgi:hypothetical protein